MKLKLAKPVIAIAVAGLALAACSSAPKPAVHTHKSHQAKTTGLTCPAHATCPSVPNAQLWAQSSNTPSGSYLGEVYVQGLPSTPSNPHINKFTLRFAALEKDVNESPVPVVTKYAYTASSTMASQFDTADTAALNALEAAWYLNTPGTYPVLAGHWPTYPAFTGWVSQWMDPKSPWFEDVADNFNHLGCVTHYAYTDLGTQQLACYISGQYKGDEGQAGNYTPDAIYSVGVMLSVPTVHHATYVQIVNGQITKAWIPYKVAYARTGVAGNKIIEIWTYITMINDHGNWVVWQPTYLSSSTFPDFEAVDAWTCPTSVVTTFNAQSALATALSYRAMAVPAGCSNSNKTPELPFG